MKLLTLSCNVNLFLQCFDAFQIFTFASFRNMIRGKNGTKKQLSQKIVSNENNEVEVSSNELESTSNLN